METITLKVRGMTCDGCVASVTRVLKEIDGVSNVDVSLDKAQATIAYEPGRVNGARLRTAIEGAGFEVDR